MSYEFRSWDDLAAQYEPISSSPENHAVMALIRNSKRFGFPIGMNINHRDKSIQIHAAASLLIEVFNIADATEVPPISYPTVGTKLYVDSVALLANSLD
jgi:hypothetical protein